MSSALVLVQREPEDAWVVLGSAHNLANLYKEMYFKAAPDNFVVLHFGGPLDDKTLPLVWALRWYRSWTLQGILPSDGLTKVKRNELYQRLRQSIALRNHQRIERVVHRTSQAPQGR